MKCKWWVVWATMVILLLLTVWYWPIKVPSQNDVIHFINGGTDTKAVLIDGTLATDLTFKNDAKASPSPDTTASSLIIGNYNNKVTEDLDYTNTSASHDALPHPGAAIVFADNSPPLTVEDVDWKDDSTTIDVTLPEPIEVPIKIWIVNSDNSNGLTYSVIKDQAIAAVARANQIYQQERQGITLRPDNVNSNYENKTLVAGSERLDFREFDCSLANPLNASSIQNVTTIGHEPGMLNVYYVAAVDRDLGYPSFSPFHGFSCVGVGAYDVIAIGIEASDDLLAHEVGHAFSLDHVGVAPWILQFDVNNVMHESSGCTQTTVNGQKGSTCGRHYLTEGQTYRQVTNKTLNGKIGSVLYDPTIYDLSLPFTRHCGHWLRTDLHVGNNGRVDQPEKSQCPPIEKRIWADGPLSPN